MAGACAEAAQAIERALPAVSDPGPSSLPELERRVKRFGELISALHVALGRHHVPSFATFNSSCGLYAERAAAFASSSSSSSFATFLAARQRYSVAVDRFTTTLEGWQARLNAQHAQLLQSGDIAPDYHLQDATTRHQLALSQLLGSDNEEHFCDQKQHPLSAAPTEPARPSPLLLLVFLRHSG